MPAKGRHWHHSGWREWTKTVVTWFSLFKKLLTVQHGWNSKCMFVMMIVALYYGSLLPHLQSQVSHVEIQCTIILLTANDIKAITI